MKIMIVLMFAFGVMGGVVKAAGSGQAPGIAEQAVQAVQAPQGAETASGCGGASVVALLGAPSDGTDSLQACWCEASCKSRGAGCYAECDYQSGDCECVGKCR